MARLRLAGGKVWRNAGGRRGPGPVLSTTADEWRLPLEDAPLVDDRPPGSAQTDRPILGAWFAASHSSLPPDINQAVPPGHQHAHVDGGRRHQYAAAASWAFASLALLSATASAELPPGRQHASPPSAAQAVAPRGWTLDGIRAGLPPGSTSTGRPALPEAVAPWLTWARGAQLDAVDAPLPVGQASAGRPVVAVVRRVPFVGRALEEASSSAPIPEGTPPATAAPPPRSPLVVAHVASAPGDDGVAPPDTSLPPGAGTLDARPPVRPKRPELRAFAFYYIQEEELQPPGRSAAAPPPASPRTVPSPLASSALVLLAAPVEPPPVAGRHDAPPPPPPRLLDRTQRGTAQLEPPPPPEEIPPGTPAAIGQPPPRGPYIVAHNAAAPGDDGVAPPSGEELPIGAGTASARPPARRPIARPAAFYYVVEGEPPPPGASSTSAPPRAPQGHPRHPAAPTPAPLRDVAAPALPPGGRSFESGPARRLARRPTVNGTANGLVLFPEPIAEPLPPKQPESPYDDPAAGSGSSIYEPPTPSQPGAGSPFDTPASSDGASIYEPPTPSRPRARSPFDDPATGGGGSLW